MVDVKRKKGKINIDTLRTSSRDLKGRGVKVGFPAEKSGRDTYPTGEYLVMVAIWNEFGTSKIPPRPFLLTGAKAFSNEEKKLITNVYKEVLLSSGKAEKGLEVLGQAAKVRIQKMIRDIKTPPNSPAVQAKKGTNNPLQDTNFMHNSVDYQVYNK